MGKMDNGNTIEAWSRPINGLTNVLPIPANGTALGLGVPQDSVRQLRVFSTLVLSGFLNKEN